MIKVTNFRRTDELIGRKTGEIFVELYADSLDELSNFDTEDVGLPANIPVCPGSFAYDKTGTVAIYDSEGSWNTLE